ncbi:MAG: tRNA (N(6)-L-threonylcarbamoyladenosine(37)-C(2))-methylthiotransferase MtaB [Nitrospiraceae bacterium]|nr:tRNA (N(6)-L-threonylcarbamoyladenosine(37)-C(2))-methylthiotransferase MtaB [Nitrospiraceae bacterium]
MKISVLTLGCKVNQTESSMIESALKKTGHEIVNISNSPDICVINTCTVTLKSDYHSRQLIRKANRAGARVYVTGCYSELNEALVKEMKGVEAVIQNRKKLDIISILSPNMLYNALDYETCSRSRFFVKVQDGCNNSCSYCSIPMARGSSRSIEPETILKQINNAVASGYKEIVLTGIHLGMYGKDFNEHMRLSDLLTKILNGSKINRIRLSSLEINELDEPLIELMQDSRICNHLHIPLQSGSKKTLRLMNRQYTPEHFREKIEIIYKKFTGISIGTDVIVGFPGELESEFHETHDMLEQLPFSYIHIFPFSERPNTKASIMPDKIISTVKKTRVQKLNELNKQKKSKYMTSQIGKTLQTLIENKTYNDKCIGTTSNYLKIHIPINTNLCGTLLLVRVEGVKNNTLFGSPIII